MAEAGFKNAENIVDIKATIIAALCFRVVKIKRDCHEGLPLIIESGPCSSAVDLWGLSADAGI